MWCVCYRGGTAVKQRVIWLRFMYLVAFRRRINLYGLWQGAWMEERLAGSGWLNRKTLRRARHTKDGFETTVTTKLAGSRLVQPKDETSRTGKFTALLGNSFD